MPTLPRFVLALCTFAACPGLPGQVRWTHLTSARNELPAPTGAAEQTACVVADFNADGRDDFVVASRKSGGKIEVWLTRNGGFDRRLVEGAGVQPEAGGAVHDIDGDGDLDLVLGQDSTGNSLYWWENPYPTFTSAWRRRLVRSNPGNKHHDQVFGDFDGDGAQELAAWNQGSRQLLLFDVPSNPRRATAWPVTTVWRSPHASFEGLAAADIDLDGKVDIVGAGRWWKHRGGNTYQENVIDSGMPFTTVAVGQLREGGRPEVVFAPGETNGNAFWYEWNGSSWVRRLLTWVAHGHTVAIDDLDQDGHRDVLLGEMKLGRSACELNVWYGDGAGAFRKQTLATGNGIHEGRLADIDGDGDTDIVHKPFNDGTPRVELWRNDNASLWLDRWRRQQLAALPAQAIFVRGADLDGDGWVDLVAGDAWYRNPRVKNVSWNKAPIGAPFHNLACVFDFDGDGDLDLLGTRGKGSQSNAQFAWAENDGRGGFTVRTNVASGQGDFLQGVAAGRFGGASAPLEVALSWHDASQGVQMLRVPANPRTQQWTWRRLTPFSLGEDLSAADVDGDGDRDLVLGTAWLENPSWRTHTIGSVRDLKGIGGTPEPDRNSAVDVDGDGDLDCVVGLENGREILWFENPRPQRAATNPWARHVIGVSAGQGFSMDVADMDADGDPDVVVGEHRGSNVNRILVFVNSGNASSWPVRTIDSQSTGVIDHHDGTQLHDVDGDGDLDVFSLGWTHPKLWWFENLARDGRGRRAPAPIIEPGSGVFRTNRFVTLRSTLANADIRFTLDGSEPSGRSPRAIGPIYIGDTQALKARVFANGLDPSDVARADYARIRDELVHWRFDQLAGAGALDDGPNSRHGLIVNATRTAGRVHGALELPGSKAFVMMLPFDVDGSAFSISALFRADRFDHLSARDPRIVSKAAGTPEQQHYWMLSTIARGNETVLRFRLKTGGVTRTLIAGSGDVRPGRWAHAAAVYDGREMRLYLDGRLVGRMPASGRVDRDIWTPVWIGDAPPVGGRPFDGLIDDVRLFGRSITDLEILALSQHRTLPGTVRYGYSTRSCARAAHVEALRSPTAGDSLFGLTASDLPPNAIGLFVVGFAPGNGTRTLGVNLFIDPFAGPTLFHPALSTPQGDAGVPLPLVFAPKGVRMFAQALWLNNRACPGSGFLGASDALMLDVR